MSCNCLLANELVALLVSGMAAIMDACVMERRVDEQTGPLVP